MQFARLAYKDKPHEKETAGTPGNVDQISLRDTLPAEDTAGQNEEVGPGAASLTLNITLGDKGDAESAEGQKRQVGNIKCILERTLGQEEYRRFWKDVEVPAGPREIAMQMIANPIY